MIGVAYIVVMALLALYGFHRAYLAVLFLRKPAPVVQGASPLAGQSPASLPIPGPVPVFPVVTVQLPLFNELYVAARLLDAVAAIRWPPDRLEIQVLDDSTDETTPLVAAKVAALRARGLDAVHLHRTDRAGFKAGALAHGLARARGEFLLVFDADFIPGPEILERTIPIFADPKIGMVQARWGHVNRDFSLLTEAQALMLDAHFVIEHGARCAAGRFFNFSGTAGVWRRAAIEDAGGWDYDTLTEDMDLSYRAQLRGWRFHFAEGTVVPAELPVDMNAFKSQQFRWAKGQMQVARKLLPDVLGADLPFAVKLEAFVHLTNNVAYPLLLVASLLLAPMFFVGRPPPAALAAEVALFCGTSLSLALFYAVAARRLGRGAWSAIRRIPSLMAICAGLSVSQSRAVVEALAGRVSEFVRTPKHGVRARREKWAQKKYRGARSLWPLVELAFAAYFAAAVPFAIRAGYALTVPFLAIFAVGFAYVGGLSLYQRW